MFDSQLRELLAPRPAEPTNAPRAAVPGLSGVAMVTMATGVPVQVPHIMVHLPVPVVAIVRQFVGFNITIYFCCPSH